MLFLRRMAWVLACLSLAVVVLGALGALHPAFDTVAVVRVPALILPLVLVAVLRQPRWIVLPLAAFCAAGLAVTFIPTLPGGAPGPIAIYSKNLSFRNTSLSAIAGDIRASGADVVTLQEVTETSGAFLAGLADLYPHQHVCEYRGWDGMAVLSRLPFEGDPRCSPTVAAAAARVRFEDGPVWIVAAHFHWPWPHAQAESVQMVEEIMSGTTGPLILAGDFNMVPWAFAVKKLEAATGGHATRPRHATFSLEGIVPLPIDHVIAGGGTVQRRPRLGSDHWGLLARVHPAPGFTRP